ncbi:hypothetical protein WH47_10545, partial [Habropoda laboriosa]
LKREFKTKVNNAVIHEQLAKRKRLSNESARQCIHTYICMYAGAMQEIVSQGHIEDGALIEHTINGLQGDEMNKTLLYDATTLHGIKKRLELYDTRKEKAVDNKRYSNKKKTRKPNKGLVQREGKKPHCYGCGRANHVYQNCTNKAKGLKCFECNNFGHIAPKCPETEKLRK